MRTVKEAIAAALLATLAAPIAGVAGGPADLVFDQVVGFGDSLSDPGNVWTLTGEQTLAPYGPIPPAPYAIGGHHFSNGATWLEKLAVGLNDPLGGKGAFVRPSYTNYATGAARARFAGTSPPLTVQVGAYLTGNGGADADALHVIWIGGNDVRDALPLLGSDPAAAFGILTEALTAIEDNIRALQAAGAEYFLVANVPNLGILPAIQSLGPATIGGAQYLSGTFNSQFGPMLAGLANELGIEIHQLDIWTIMNSVYYAPGAFGLSNSTTPCLSFGVQSDAVCDNPDEHLFWDAIHPTTKAHGILADQALGLLTSP